jgi:hypothetical protein
MRGVKAGPCTSRFGPLGEQHCTLPVKVRGWGQLESWLKRIADLDMNPVWEMVFQMPPNWYGSRRRHVTDVLSMVRSMGFDIGGLCFTSPGLGISPVSATKPCLRLHHSRKWPTLHAARNRLCAKWNLSEVALGQILQTARMEGEQITYFLKISELSSRKSEDQSTPVNGRDRRVMSSPRIEPAAFPNPKHAPPKSRKCLFANTS